jgi:hypothetical protein
LCLLRLGKPLSPLRLNTSHIFRWTPEMHGFSPNGAS